MISSVLLLLYYPSGLSSALRDVAVPIFSWSNSEPFLSGCIRKLGSVFDSSSSSLDGLVSERRTRVRRGRNENVDRKWRNDCVLEHWNDCMCVRGLCVINLGDCV